MPKPSGLHRRDFMSVAATGLALAGAGTARAGQPTETNSSISPQPTPAFGSDQTTADTLVETLIAWGATHAFGIVGDGINSIIEAMRKRQDKIRYIGVRHEEAAAFMASGFAKHIRAPASARKLPPVNVNVPLRTARSPTSNEFRDSLILLGFPHRSHEGFQYGQRGTANSPSAQRRW
jgi:hypothetical protein